MDIEIIAMARKQDERIDFNYLVFLTRGANVFDAGAGEEFWLFMKTLIEGGALKIAVDMDGLDFIDSLGIGVLVNCAKLIRQKGGDIVLYRVPEHIDRIFGPLRLNRFIRIFDEMHDIMRFFRTV